VLLFDEKCETYKEHIEKIALACIPTATVYRRGEGVRK
jgi:hypothetical protein